MSRIFACILVSILAVGLQSCSPGKPVADEGPESTPKPTRLVFDSVLLDGTRKTYTVLADVNSDSKLDLILGTNGHEYSSASPNIRTTREYGEERTDLSIHLNRSTADTVTFADPYFPKESGPESSLPFG